MGWCWASATRIGTSHERNGTECQDVHRCLEVAGTLIAIASDGAGSASHGRAGANLACRTMATGLATIVAAGRMPDDEDLADIVDAVRDRIALAASRRDLASRDFAATLVAVVAGGDDTLAIHVGDGAAVVATSAGWSAASWPDNGEFANTTFFVTDDAGPRLRIARTGGPVELVAVTTDGLERLALDLAGGVPHAPFFDGMMGALAPVSGRGRSASVSRGLAVFLGSDGVCARTDDDKTLILARRL